MVPFNGYFIIFIGLFDSLEEKKMLGRRKRENVLFNFSENHSVFLIYQLWIIF